MSPSFYIIFLQGWVVFYSPPQHTSPSYSKRSLCEPSPVPSNENKLPDLHEHSDRKKGQEKRKPGEKVKNTYPTNFRG